MTSHSAFPPFNCIPIKNLHIDVIQIVLFQINHLPIKYILIHNESIQLTQTKYIPNNQLWSNQLSMMHLHIEHLLLSSSTIAKPAVCIILESVVTIWIESSLLLYISSNSLYAVFYSVFIIIAFKPISKFNQWHDQVQFCTLFNAFCPCISIFSKTKSLWNFQISLTYRIHCIFQSSLNEVLEVYF